MSANAVPPPMAAGPSDYALSPDEAEQASLPIRPAITRSHSKSATFSTSYTGGTLFSNSANEGSTAAARSYTLAHLGASFLSLLSFFWRWKETRREGAGQLYSVFKSSNVDNYPEGYPQLAAFMNSDESFAIFRKFGQTNCRVMIHLQSEIAALEKELEELDRSDARDGSSTSYRLVSTEHRTGWDTRQKDILKQLEEKLPVYYDLMLKDKQLRAIGPPLKRDHRSVFHWIEWKKPIAKGEDDWILHKDDLVTLANIDHFESSLITPWSRLLFGSSKHGVNEKDLVVTYFSQMRVTGAAKLFSVLVAVAILIIPISLFLWVPLSRGWTSATVIISVLVFSTMLSLSTNIKVRDILLGSAAYCAVLATFLGNLQSGSGSTPSNPR